MGKREENREMKRQAIVEAAERLFLTQGFEETTMNRVAKESGLSKGLLFYYFGTKESLALEILRGYTEAQTKALMGLSATLKGSGRERLEALLLSIVNASPEEQEAQVPVFRLRQYMLNRLLSGLMEAADVQTYERLFQDSILPFTHLITAGQADGSIRNDQSAEALAVQISVPIGSAYEYMLGFRQLPTAATTFEEGELRTLVKTLVQSLMPR